MTTIKWKTTAQDVDKIEQIAERAEVFGWRGNRTQTLMDLTACHANGCPLDLDKMLTFDAFNLIHDLAGLRDHMDRETGKLSHHFLPRGAKRGV